MKKAFSIFIIFVVIAIASISHAATYYVRKDGHDTSCNGTADASVASAPNCAWLTIQKAATTLSGTQTVIVGNGTYSEFVTFAKSGTNSSNMLTFQAQNKWLAIIDKSERVVLVSGNYVKLDGFMVQGFVYSSQYHAVQVTGSYNVLTNLYSNQNQNNSIDIEGTYNTLSNSYILKPQYGIRVAGIGNLIVNNEVDQLYAYAATSDVDYIRVASGANHIIRGNYLHGNTYPTGSYWHVDCVQTWNLNPGEATTNLLIENNTCYDAHEGFNMSNDRGDSVTIIMRNNVVRLKSSIYPDVQGVCCFCNYGIPNFKVYNNTCDINGGWYGLLTENSGSGVSSDDFRNNIVVNYSVDGSPYFKSPSWIVPPNKNLLYSPYKTAPQVNFPNDIVNQNPLFISSTDYHLQSGSPAKDAGVTIGTFYIDKDGVTRPQGLGWDIGAYEFNDLSLFPPSNLRILSN